MLRTSKIHHLQIDYLESIGVMQQLFWSVHIKHTLVNAVWVFFSFKVDCGYPKIQFSILGEIRNIIYWSCRMMFKGFLLRQPPKKNFGWLEEGQYCCLTKHWWWHPTFLWIGQEVPADLVAAFKFPFNGIYFGHSYLRAYFPVIIVCLDNCFLWMLRVFPY